VHGKRVALGPKIIGYHANNSLAKFCHVDGDLFLSRSGAPIPPMINNRQWWVSYIKENIHNFNLFTVDIN
jgi:hypothetical protein